MTNDYVWPIHDKANCSLAETTAALVVAYILCLKKFKHVFFLFVFEQVCRSCLLWSRNVRWPRRTLPLVSHGEYADGTDRQTDGRQAVSLRFPLWTQPA